MPSEPRDCIERSAVDRNVQPAYRISSMLSGTTEGKSTLLVMTFAGADLEGIKAQLESWGGTIHAQRKSETRRNGPGRD